MATNSLQQQSPDEDRSRRIQEGKKRDEQRQVEQSRSEEIQRGKTGEEGGA